MKLIDKDALVAEIERREGLLDLDNPLGIGGMVNLEYLKSILDTLEVKEVDLEKELIDKVIGWIKEINNHHHIMRYSDSCEPAISELIEWFKNYMKSNAS